MALMMIDRRVSLVAGMSQQGFIDTSVIKPRVQQMLVSSRCKEKDVAVVRVEAGGRCGGGRTAALESLGE